MLDVLELLPDSRLGGGNPLWPNPSLDSSVFCPSPAVRHGSACVSAGAA